MSKVIVIDSKYRDIHENMKKVFDFLNLEIKDKKILIKPNILWPSEPEQGINTHPEFILAAVNECIGRGAKEVLVGDNAGQIMYGRSKKSFEGSGLSEKLGKYYVNLGINLEPYYLNTIGQFIYVSKVLKEVDMVIGLPKFKTHKLTGITGAIKNTFGYLPGAQKARTHVIARSHERFGQALAEIHNIKRPVASIMDGILGMQGNGATSKDLRYIGNILASCDSVALDSVMAEMMGMKPEGILHLKYAKEMGIGSMDDIEVIGNHDYLEGFMLAPGFKDPSVLRKTVSSEGLEKDAARTKPSVDYSKCDGCGLCIKECPVHALKMVKYPELIQGKCISCHACQEVCPKEAIIVDAV